MRPIATAAAIYRNLTGRNRPPEYSLSVDFPVNPRPRYGYGRPAHARLAQILDARRETYRSILESFLAFRSDLWRIAQAPAGDPRSPVWVNGFIPGLDSISLYSLIRLHRPRLYVEIGSGNSTRFARRAIDDGRLETKIISVDPHPRVEIRPIADRLIEQPVEDIPLDIFDSLQSGDLLFVDNSHRVFTNSDVTVVFLDILPNLKPGVLVHFHDIFLPEDYPPAWNQRYYSEQYLVACHLLARTQCFEVLLANMFISRDPQLSALAAPLWDHPSMQGVERHGCSFWVRIKEDSTHNPNARG